MVKFELFYLVPSDQISSSPVTLPSAGAHFWTVTVTACGACQSEPVCSSKTSDFGTFTIQSKALNVISEVINFMLV